jgi:hypothetical protein
MSRTIESALAEDLRELAAHRPPQASQPDLDAVIRRGRALRRRRVLVPGAVAAVSAAGAAAIVLASGPGLAAHRPDGAAHITSARALQVRLAAAYTSAKRSLEVTDVSEASGQTTETITVPSQQWTETIDSSASGARESVSFTYELPRPERLTLTLYHGDNQKETVKGLFWVFKTLRIDYTTQHYYIDTAYAPAGKNGQRNADAQFFPLPQPESLKTSSWSKLTGTATVDGQPTYVLAQTGSGGVTATTWVSQKTLLPVQDVVHTYVGTSTDHYTYATAAGATAAASQPSIPAGFTKGGGTAGAPAVPAS